MLAAVAAAVPTEMGRLSMSSKDLLKRACLMVLPLLAGQAAADDELPDVSDRYDGTGRHAGSFWLFSTVTTGLFYDSNVLGTPSGADGEAGVFINPRLEANSDWGNHALNIVLDASQYEYFDASEQSRTNFDGTIDGRIDVRRDLVIEGGVEGAYVSEAAGAIFTSPFADEPTEHSELAAWAAVNKAFNRLSVSVGAAYRAYDYYDVGSIAGGDIDQDFRDGGTAETGGRVSYLFSPGYRWFSDVRYNWRDYDNGANGSDGWRGLTGLEFEITRLLRGEVGAGYMEQYYGAGHTESDFSYHAALVWNPTPLMTVSFDADRIIQDSSIVGSLGAISDKLKAVVDYEVKRGVVVSPSFEVQLADYQGIGRTAETYDLGLNVAYALNRFLTLGTAYTYTHSDIDGTSAGSDGFERHMFGVYAKARL